MLIEVTEMACTKDCHFKTSWNKGDEIDYISAIYDKLTSYTQTYLHQILHTLKITDCVQGRGT
jgi:hypothetical protein